MADRCLCGGIIWISVTMQHFVRHVFAQEDTFIKKWQLRVAIKTTFLGASLNENDIIRCFRRNITFKFFNSAQPYISLKTFIMTISHRARNNQIVLLFQRASGSISPSMEISQRSWLWKIPPHGDQGRLSTRLYIHAHCIWEDYTIFYTLFSSLANFLIISYFLIVCPSTKILIRFLEMSTSIWKYVRYSFIRE